VEGTLQEHSFAGHESDLVSVPDPFIPDRLKNLLNQETLVQRQAFSCIR
jgi:hypothetical protein